MKIYNQNKGAGGIIYTHEGTRYIAMPGEFVEVPDAVGEAMIAKYPKLIRSGGAESAKIPQKVVDELATLKAENAALNAQISKLQLIAAQVPVGDNAKDAEIATLKARIAELETKPKRGPKPKEQAAPEVPEVTTE